MGVSLRTVPLFAELSDDHIARIDERSELVTLQRGETLFSEGDAGDRAYVIHRGELEIVTMAGNREVLLAVRKPGEVIGEMALLQDVPRSATARARTEVELVAIPKAEIDALMESSTEAMRALFDVVLDRWQGTQAMLTQSERMAQLGTLTAGLAHELNNPAAAVNRAVGQLGDAVQELVAAERHLAVELPDGQRTAVDDLRRDLLDTSRTDLDALTRSDLEYEVEEALESAEIADAWKLAPALVEAGLADRIDTIVEVAGDRTDRLLEVVRAGHEVSSLLGEVEEGTRRLSAIVGALKSYSYLDRAPVQEVDLTRGLDDTLLILKSELADIEVARDYAIHEAGTDDGRIEIRAHPEGDHVVVEIEDNGPGIPADIVHRVFDSFFTTKPPGQGTGLGLDISYAIVAHKHGGEVTVESEPGRTVFRVTLPRTVPD